jgi:hypothetical protein
VPRTRKSATARTSQQAETSAHASAAARREVVRGLNQRPSRKRSPRLLAAGVLEVHIQKPEQSKPRRLAVMTTLEGSNSNTD